MTLAARVLFSLLLAALLAQGGCLQTEYETTIYPDGSGKMFVQVGIRQSVIKRLREYSGRPAEVASEELTTVLKQIQKPEHLKEYMKGMVGWKPIKVEEDATWLRATYTVYFDDISQVEIYTDATLGPKAPGKQLVFSWRLVKASNGQSTLYQMTGLKGLPALKARPEDQAQARVLAEQIRPHLEDLQITFKVKVPGTIQESKGALEASGTSASWKMDGPLLLGTLTNLEGPETKRLRVLMDTPESRISWTESALSAAQLEAWKQELAAAKAEWKGTGGAALSDNELERSFIRAKLSAATAHLDAGRKDKARKILEDIVQEYPNHKETLTAKALLEKLGK